MVINFFINFVWGWVAFSSGAPSPASWPGIHVWALSNNTCVALDLFLSALLVGGLGMLAGTGGIQREVAAGRCGVLDPALLEHPSLRRTPLPVRGLLRRSLATGLFLVGALATPMLLLVWIAVGNGAMAGLSWVVLKAFWAAVAAAAAQCIVFPSAISRDNLPA